MLCQETKKDVNAHRICEKLSSKIELFSTFHYVANQKYIQLQLQSYNTTIIISLSIREVKDRVTENRYEKLFCFISFQKLGNHFSDNSLIRTQLENKEWIKKLLEIDSNQFDSNTKQKKCMGDKYKINTYTFILFWRNKYF